VYCLGKFKESELLVSYSLQRRPKFSVNYGSKFSNPGLFFYLFFGAYMSFLATIGFLGATPPSCGSINTNHGSPRGGNAVSSSLPMESKSRMSPFSLDTAKLPEKVVATPKNLFLWTYYLNWLSASLVPDTQERVVGGNDEDLLVSGVGFDVVVEFPSFDDITVLDIHTVEGIGVGGVLEEECFGFEALPLGSCDVANGGILLDSVGMVEVCRHQYYYPGKNKTYRLAVGVAVACGASLLFLFGIVAVDNNLKGACTATMSDCFGSAISLP